MRHAESLLLTRAGSRVLPSRTILCSLGRNSLRAWLAVSLAWAAVFAVITAAQASEAENIEISMRRSVQRTSFSNEEIRDGFFKTAFHAELQFGRRVDRIRKFDAPVRVFVEDHAGGRSADISAIVADIRAHVDHLDVAMATEKDANLLVMLVPRHKLESTIRQRYGDKVGQQIKRVLRPQCLSGIAKDNTYRIVRGEVILPADAEDFEFHDCAYEELLQALGIINDDNSVPWTMFNDDVQMGFFDLYDQLLVNVLYHPRVRRGMTKAQVDKVLPEILPTVRTWVANANTPQGAAPFKSFRQP